MFSTRKLVGFLCFLVVALTGCKPLKVTASAEDYFPLAKAALQGGEVSAMILRNEAIENENFALCVTAEALIPAFREAHKELSPPMLDTLEIDPIVVDYEDCLPFQDKELEGSDSAAQMYASVAGIALSTAHFYSMKVPDCKSREGLLKMVEYLSDLSGPISQQIKDPEGPFVLPGLVLDLKACKSD